MTTTANLGMTLLTVGQTGKETSVNDALLLIDAAAGAFDVSGFFIGLPAATQLIGRFVAVRAFTLPVSLTGSKGRVVVNATVADALFDIQKNGSSIGTMTFAVATATATFIFASPVTFAAGDYLDVFGPGTPNAALSTVAWTFKGVL